MTTFTALTLRECPRCARYVFAGHVAGFHVHLDTLTVPRTHAAVLHHYGHLVLVADLRLTGLWADFWAPGLTDLDRPDRHLLITHVCSRVRKSEAAGSRHRRKEDHE